MRTLVRFLYIFSLTAICVACGGGGGGGGNGGDSAPPPPPADQAIGGIWFGTDNEGLEILGASTESGRIHWVSPDTGEQGFGTASVNGTAITINYTWVAELGFVLEDGSTSATCSATGTIQEYQSIAVTTNCTTGLGSTFSASASLNYDSLYDRDSSLSVIAGNYDDGGLILNIAANGVIFEQGSSTGCIISGQVAIIDSQFNVYDVSMTFSTCLGDFAILNGATFTGLGILDNTVTPEELTFAMTGVVEGVTGSFVITLPRYVGGQASNSCTTNVQGCASDQYSCPAAAFCYATESSCAASGECP